MANPHPKPGPGRPKGSVNKNTSVIKTRIMEAWQALEDDGKGLIETGKADPPWFYANFVKPMIPKDVVLSGDSENPIETKWTVTIIKPDLNMVDKK